MKCKRVDVWDDVRSRQLKPFDMTAFGINFEKSFSPEIFPIKIFSAVAITKHLLAADNTKFQFPRTQKVFRSR